MKIALLIERMDTFRGGREMSLAQIAVELVARGHDVSIICQSASWSHDKVQVRQLGTRGFLRLQRLRNFIADNGPAIRSGNYDIVHTTFPLPGANVYQPRGGTIPAQIDSRIRRTPRAGRLLVSLTERLKPSRLFMKKLEARLVADTSVICLPGSNMLAREFQTHYQRSDGVRVVYNAVDAPDANCSERPQWRQQLRKQVGISSDALVLLTAATNFPLKGVRQAISAFAQWYGRAGRQDAFLIVLGQDSPTAYRRFAIKQGIGQQVIFVGPTERIFQWYAAADACILLSWYDPCSRVVLEATRWGIPSITTAFNGAAEMMDEGGIVVDSPTDAAAIVAAIDRLSDVNQRSELARNCLHVADKLTIQRHVDQLLEVYQSLSNETKVS